MRTKIVMVTAALLFLAMSIAAQNKPLAFLVASIKPGNPLSGIDMRTFPGGRLTATNVTLNQLIMAAYTLKRYQIAGGPTWIESDRFEIEAKADETVIKDQEQDRVLALGREAPRQMMVMLQTLLADRFRVKLHRETRQDTVYRLLVAKNGPKLSQTSDASQRPFVGLSRTGSPLLAAVSYVISGKNASMSQLVQFLGNTLGHTTLDETGITGNFDFSFEYASDDNQLDGRPSIYTAIQERTGLKLEAGKGPIEVLVIDHAEKPDAN